MSDANPINAGENSAEGVAYKLMQVIMATEGKAGQTFDRNYILMLYAECLRAVRDPRFQLSKNQPPPTY
jgi:hypothetical protein